MRISELIKELTTWKENWGDMEVLIDDGIDFMDDVDLKASASVDEPNIGPSLLIFSKKSLERK